MARPIKQPEKWYHLPWFGIPKGYITFSVVFGMGLTVGSFVTNVKRDLDETKLRQEYQEKIQIEIDKSRKKEIDLYIESYAKLEKNLNNISVVNDNRKN